MPRNPIIQYRRDLKQKARLLRKEGTLGEVLLWGAVRKKQLGCEFHRQVPVGSFILDFFCHEKMLAVEIDGSSHDDEKQMKRDARRQTLLEQRGIHVLRFTEHEIRDNLDGVVSTLLDWLSDEAEQKEQ
jgi:very-short-patch-repair endonuclease